MPVVGRGHLTRPGSGEGLGSLLSLLYEPRVREVKPPCWVDTVSQTPKVASSDTLAKTGKATLLSLDGELIVSG